MSIPSDKNISLKTFEKLSKYKDLEIKIENKMWKLKTTTTSAVSGALVAIKKIPVNLLTYYLKE